MQGISNIKKRTSVQQCSSLPQHSFICVYTWSLPCKAIESTYWNLSFEVLLTRTWMASCQLRRFFFYTSSFFFPPPFFRSSIACDLIASSGWLICLAFNHYYPSPFFASASSIQILTIEFNNSCYSTQNFWMNLRIEIEKTLYCIVINHISGRYFRVEGGGAGRCRSRIRSSFEKLSNKVTKTV